MKINRKIKDQTEAADARKQHQAETKKVYFYRKIFDLISLAKIRLGTQSTVTSTCIGKMYNVIKKKKKVYVMNNENS